MSGACGLSGKLVGNMVGAPSPDQSPIVYKVGRGVQVASCGGRGMDAPPPSRPLTCPSLPTGESTTTVAPQVPGGVSDGRWHSVRVQYYNKVGLPPSGSAPAQGRRGSYCNTGTSCCWEGKREASILQGSVPWGETGRQGPQRYPWPGRQRKGSFIRITRLRFPAIQTEPGLTWSAWPGVMGDWNVLPGSPGWGQGSVFSFASFCWGFFFSRL